MRKHLLFMVLLFLVLCLCVPVSLAQNTVSQAPSSLPGYSVSFNAGASFTNNNATSNGFFGSVAIPIYTIPGALATKYGMTISGRADYFTLANPSDYVLTGGPEFRLQVSKPDLLSGQAFQPFVNIGFGLARNECVAANNCAAGVDASTHGAFKAGFGLDIPVSTKMSLRILEVDLIHSTLFPGRNIVVSNAAQLSMGLGIKF